MQPTCLHLRDLLLYSGVQVMHQMSHQSCGDQLYHTTDNSEVEQGQEETTQVKKHDQSDSDEALYLPPLPPDQLDTVVKVTTVYISSTYVL